MPENDDGIFRVDFQGINNPNRAVDPDKRLFLSGDFIYPETTIDELRTIYTTESATYEESQYRLSHLLKFTNRDHYLGLIRKHISDELGIGDVAKALVCGLTKFCTSEEVIGQYSTKFPAAASFLSVIPRETLKAFTAINKDLVKKAGEYAPEVQKVFASAVVLEALLDMIILKLSSDGYQSVNRSARIADKYRESPDDFKVMSFGVMKRYLAEMVCLLIIEFKNPAGEHKKVIEDAETFLETCMSHISIYLKNPDLRA